MPTFEQIITAEFDFAAMKELIFKIYTHPYVDKAVQFVAEFVESISPFLWAGILLALGLVLSNFGKKLLAVPLVVGIAGIGFLGGYNIHLCIIEGNNGRNDFLTRINFVKFGQNLIEQSFVKRIHFVLRRM